MMLMVYYGAKIKAIKYYLYYSSPNRAELLRSLRWIPIQNQSAHRYQSFPVISILCYQLCVMLSSNLSCKTLVNDQNLQAASLKNDLTNFSVGKPTPLQFLTAPVTEVHILTFNALIAPWTSRIAITGLVDHNIFNRDR